jgi:putative glutamine amidotransferase
MAVAAPPIPWAPGAARPLIACSSSELREKATIARTEHGEPANREIALGLQYTQAVEQAGGVPVIVPPVASATIDPLLDCASGLLLSGGPDIHPSAYGEEPDPQLGPTWPELDSIELSITRQALDRGMPILAVCRGLQLLNVARGGTLVQHLPDRVGERVHHRQDAAGGRTTHWVRIERGSQLATILDRHRTTVNSFHHQAVDRLGEGLVPTAWASDGMIEGLEDPSRPFVVAVQWHAESLISRRPHAALFAAFVQAAAQYSAQRRAPAAVSAVA